MGDAGSDRSVPWSAARRPTDGEAAEAEGAPRAGARGTSGTVVIRPATPEDEPALGRLGALLVHVHHGFDPERFLDVVPETSARYGSFLRAQLDQPDALVLVAELGGEIVGYAYAADEGYDYASLRGPAGVIHDLVVDPAHRRQGLGRRLLDAAVTELESRGVPRIVVMTAERNELAQRMCAQAGFRRTMIEMTRESKDARGAS